MKNILTSISLEKTVQSSLHLDVEKKRQKLTIDAVRQYIESFGYKLISTQYVKALAKLEIVCPNQHRYLASYNHFQRGSRCPECWRKSKKHTIDAVKRYIESFGYKLISTEYVNAHVKLKIICPNQHRYLASYNRFQSGIRCAECAELKKRTIERQHIESFGYRLRSTTYAGTHAKLDLVCPLGHSYRVSYASFKQGIRCAECSFISQRRTMPNGEEWEPYGRNSKADKFWAIAVKKRDNYTCQACFYPSKAIHAHHIESYGKNPELRTELSNGVTLCEPCHRELHSRYGVMTATRANLEEFIRFKTS